MSDSGAAATAAGRHFFVLAVFALIAALLVGRWVYLQSYEQPRLAKEAEQRQLRTIKMPEPRGTITDRNGKLLAVSIPAYAVWINPVHFNYQDDSSKRIAKFLQLEHKALRDKLEKKKNKQFIYVKRRVAVEEAEALLQQGIAGVGLKREYQRYYPMAEAAAHLIGVTDVDDRGIEGLERAFNVHLSGKSGSKLIQQDLHGRVIKDIKLIEPPQPAGDLVLSIDRRIQYRAYRALKMAVHEHQAKSGSIVMLDTKSGEVLAMVNRPSFNSNDRKHIVPEIRRNRAVTNEIEPGSTIKPFVVAALLQNNRMSLDDTVQTHPGYRRIAEKGIRDIRNYGELSVADVVVKSSNVGISKVAERLLPVEMWGFFQKLGFGGIPGTGFPGEIGGTLKHHSEWYEIDQAIMAYGYGLSVSPLQLAYAYTAIANNGWQPALSLYKNTDQISDRRQVMNAAVAQSLRRVLKDAVSRRGTGSRARIDGFTVAGKTGTVRKYEGNDYSEEDYVSIFAGFAPADNPRIVSVVVINGPSVGGYYGGQVAAPVFAATVGDALRILGVPEDEVESDVDESEPYILTRVNSAKR